MGTKREILALKQVEADIVKENILPSELDIIIEAMEQIASMENPAAHWRVAAVVQCGGKTDDLYKWYRAKFSELRVRVGFTIERKNTLIVIRAILRRDRPDHSDVYDEFEARFTVAAAKRK